MAAMSGCLSSSSGDASTSQEPEEFVDGEGGFENVGGIDGSVVKTDHLLTDSRNADVVVWKDDDGTVYADGEEEVVASGDDFTSVVQAAVDQGVSKLVIQDGDYVAQDPINLDSDTIVTGMGTETSIEVAGSAGFRVDGEKDGSAPLTADAGVDDGRISVADTGPFSTDELVLVNSDRRTDYRGQLYGEIRRVTEVDDANGEIALTAGGLFDEYRTENNAKAVAIDEVENVAVRDLEFVGSDQQAYRSGVVASLGQRIMVENARMRNLGHSGVIYSSTIYSAVENCKIHNVAYENGGVGYGVTLADAVRNVRVRNNVFHDTKNHCTTVGGSGADGYPRLLTFENNEYYEDDADVHMGGVMQFKANRFANGAGGIITGADTTYVSDCEFRNLDGNAINHRGNPEELVVVDSQFNNVDGMAINLYSNPRGMQKVTIAGNDFTDIGANVLRFRTPDGSTCDFVGVTENVINGCGTNAFNLTELGDSTIENVNFVNNHFEDVDGFTAAASPSGPLRFATNTMKDVGGSYAAIFGGTTNLVSNNDLSGYPGRGYLVKGPGLTTANLFSEGGNDAILLYGAEDNYVTHNKFRNTGGADIYAIDSTDCKIVRNDVATQIEGGGPNQVRENTGYQTEASGSHTASGSGARSYTIPHDLTAPAETANVWAESPDAAGAFYVSDKSADSITVTYRNAPPTGSNNLTWGYEVKTYTR